jgi:predicted ATPase
VLPCVSAFHKFDDPETILSSSQMTALAVAVFLALNLGARVPLEAIVLDDPLQSLDDVNLLGLVDLLRRAKEHRQLLISTHDERFGNLLARKLRPGMTSHRTVLIELGDWKRAGPLVRATNVEADSKPLRLAAS